MGKNKRKQTTNAIFQSLHIPRQAVIYLLVFFGFLALFIASFMLFKQYYAAVFLKPVAHAGYIILKITGLDIAFDTGFLQSGYCDYVLPHQVLRVNFGCTGLYVLFIFLAAVLAYPASIRKKIIGFAIGIPLFTAYSIIRLIVMGITGNWFPEYLTFIHNYLMIIINIAFVLWLYSLWLEYGFEKLKYNFFIRFLAGSLFLLIIWKPVSTLYLHVISAAANAFFTIIGHSVSLYVEGDVLNMLYPPIARETLSFAMRDADQIFLNLIVLAALIFSSHRVARIRRLKYGAISVILLAFIHVLVVCSYTYVTIWNYVGTLTEPLRSEVTARASVYFSESYATVYEYIIFNWNSWRWDVIPLLLWIPAGLVQFSFLLKPLINRNSA